MRYLVFDDMGSCTEADVIRLLPLVSHGRREQALKYRHLRGRWQCLKSAEMLMQLLGVDNLPDFSYNPYGKPFIEGYPDFSISHCPAALAVAVAEDGKKVGIDVESVRPVNDPLIAYVMNPDERNAINSAADRNEMFTAYWTKKEALLKCRGTGINTGLKDVLSSGDNDEKKSVETFFHPSHSYVFSIAKM